MGPNFRKFFSKIGFILSVAFVCLALVSCQGMNPTALGGLSGPLDGVGSGDSQGGVGGTNPFSTTLPGFGGGAVPTTYEGPEPDFSPENTSAYLIAVCQTLVSLNGCMMDDGECPKVSPDEPVKAEYNLRGRVFHWRGEVGYGPPLPGKGLKIKYRAPSNPTFEENNDVKSKLIPLKANSGGVEGFFDVNFETNVSPGWEFSLLIRPNYRGDLVGKDLEDLFEEDDALVAVNSEGFSKVVRKERRGLVELIIEWFHFEGQGVCIQSEFEFSCPFSHPIFRQCDQIQFIKKGGELKGFLKVED